MSKNFRVLPKRKSMRLKGFDYSQPASYFITICCQNRAHLFGKIVNGKMQLNEAGKMIERWFFELENKFPDVKCHEMVVMPDHFHCVLERADMYVNPKQNTKVDMQVGGRAQQRVDTQVHPKNVHPKNVHPKNVHPQNVHTQSEDQSQKESDDYTSMADICVRQTKMRSNDLRTSPTTENSLDLSHSEEVEKKNRGRAQQRMDTQVHPNIVHPQNVHPQNIQSDSIHPDQIIPEFGDHVGSSLYKVMQWFKTMSTNEYIRGVKTLGWPRFYKRMWQRNYYEIIIRNDRSFINISNYIRNNPAKWSEKLLKRKRK